MAYPYATDAGSQVGQRQSAEGFHFELLMRRLRPKWQRDGLCHEYPGLSWFPSRGQSTAKPKAVCARCLVRSECLTFALDEDLSGIWGGTSDAERVAIRRQAA